MTWIKHAGYAEDHQYVTDDGRIIGEVHGSSFEAARGWTAWDLTNLPSTWLGRYASLPDAKRAVEKHLELCEL